jgi:3-phenylpropionate/trans-cinnamate dioxygenase ferredoxin reductase component
MTGRLRRVIVVGASLAGHRVATRLRGLGYDGELTVFGAETHQPYDRYPLSKRFLSGDIDEGGLAIEPGQLEIEWCLGRMVTGLHLPTRSITVDGRQRVPFDALVVATGSRPRVPNGLRRDVDGVFVLRTIEDGAALRAALAAPQRRVVVIGAGLIGAEVASHAAADGHLTTLVDSSELPTARTLGPRVATHLRKLHLENGVKLLPDSRLTDLDVRAGLVCGVRLDTGSRLDADVVVLATGTQPNTEWLRGSGLDLQDGLLCRSTLHASGSDIVVGVGDVVRAPHPLLGGETVRVEHWASARHQASVAAMNLLVGPGNGHPQAEPPVFGSTIHGAAIRGIGFPSKADTSEVVWGSIQAGEAVVAMRRRGRLIGAVALNAAEQLDVVDRELRRPVRWTRPRGRVDELAHDVGSGRLAP